MRYIIIDKYTGMVESISEIPFDDYRLPINILNQEVIKGFDELAFDLSIFDYYFNGASFDEVPKEITMEETHNIINAPTYPITPPTPTPNSINQEENLNA